MMMSMIRSQEVVTVVEEAEVEVVAQVLEDTAEAHLLEEGGTTSPVIYHLDMHQPHHTGIILRMEVGFHSKQRLTFLLSKQ